MFVEGEIEVKIKDRAAMALDDHDLKLWVQRSFKNLACYRISELRREGGSVLRAVVAIKTSDLPTNERQLIESHPHDIGLLRSFIERMFEGKGTCRCIGDPKLRNN